MQLDGCCNLFCLLKDMYLSKPPCLEPHAHRLHLQCTVSCAQGSQLITPFVLVCFQQLFTDSLKPCLDVASDVACAHTGTLHDFCIRMVQVRFSHSGGRNRPEACLTY